MEPILMKWSTKITDTIVDVLSAVFDVLVTPLFAILKSILVILVDQVYRLISATLRTWLYMLLKIVDFFESTFDIFSGIEPVTYKGDDKTLLDVFISNDAMSTVLALVTVIGVVLCFVFTLYTVGKSIGTYVLENKNPVSHIVKQALKSCMMFLILPLIAYFGIQLSTVVLRSTDRAICNAMGSDDTIPMSTVLFLSGTFDGETNADYSTGVRAEYLNGQTSIYNEAQTIIDFKMEDLDLDLLETVLVTDGGSPNDFLSFGSGGYNYLLVYIEALVVIIIMLCGTFIFIRSIFDVILLYITAPLFVSTMPLDNGQVFRRWRELFIGKLISGYGVVFSMKIMLMLIPILVGGNVRLTGDSMIDAVIKTIFAIGSLFASFKCQHTILQAFSPEIAMAAKGTTSEILGLGKAAANLAIQAGAAVATGGVSAAGTAAAGTAGSAAGAAGAASGATGAASSAGNAFTGGAGGSVGGLSTGGAADAGKASSDMAGSGKSSGGMTDGGSSGSGNKSSGTPSSSAAPTSKPTGGSSGQSLSSDNAGPSGGLQTGDRSATTDVTSGKDHTDASAENGFSGNEDTPGGLETGGTGKTDGTSAKSGGSQAFRDDLSKVKDITDTLSSGSNKETDEEGNE